MKHIASFWIVAAALFVFASPILARRSSEAQSATPTPNPTEVAYQTQVSGLETQVAKKDKSLAAQARKIKELRTQVAQLRAQLPTPTATPAEASGTTGAVNSSGYASGGLGLSRGDWEIRHGKAQGSLGGYLNYEYYGDPSVAGTVWRYSISTYDENVWTITLQYPEGGAVDMGTAQGDARLLLPADAQFLRTSLDTTGAPTEIFGSDSLSARFPGDQGDPWFGGTAGTLTVIYGVDHAGAVFSIDIAPGDAQ